MIVEVIVIRSNDLNQSGNGLGYQMLHEVRCSCCLGARRQSEGRYD